MSFCLHRRTHELPAQGNPFICTLLGLVALVCFLGVPGSAAARSGGIDGESFTVGDMTGTLATAALDSDFSRANEMLADTLSFYLQRLEAGGVSDLTLKQLAGEVQSVDWKSRLRWRQRDYEASFRLRDQPAALEDAVRKILQVVNVPNGLDDHLVETWGEPRAAQTLAPVVGYQEQLLRISLGESLEKIRRYEVKYGPGSARLNVLETFLSYGSQWLPGFGPDDNGWPGPFEWVAGYSSTFVTVEDDEPAMVSAAQLGIRRYLWSARWPGPWNLIRPRSVAAGVLVAGEENGAFIWPGRGESRYGGFLVWGSIQLAYLGGDDPTLALTHTIQLFPGLF